MRFLEYGRRGTAVAPTKYRVLYHLCDYHSYAYVMENNVLASRGMEVSTTWDETMNRVVGKDFLVFKMILDAKALITQYGAHEFDDH